MTPFGAVQSSVTNESIAPATTQQSTSASSNNSLGSEQTFLQLLVAQLQYQDPLQPADGTQFVTQLAQYADLEQQIGSHQDLDAIKQVLTAPATPDATGANSTASGNTTADPSSSQDSNTTPTGGASN